MIGIAITCHNYEMYLRECVRSLPGDVSTVVVDDNSDDRAGVRLAAGPVPVVTLHEHRGLSIARNIGAAYLNTDYLLFLDADDWLYPDAIKSLLDVLTDDPGAAFAYGDYMQAGKRVVTPEWEPRLLDRQNIASYCNLWRREAFWQVGGYRDIPVAEDWDLQRRCARDWGYYGVKTDQLIFNHRIHSHNKWAQDSAQYGGMEGVAQWLQANS